MMIRRLLSLLMIFVFLIGIIPAYVAADSLDEWSKLSPYPTTNELRGVTYGNDKYVAVGNDGTIVTSLDGASWTSQTSGTPNLLNDITYGNSTYVAVGADGTVMTSIDGVMWTSQTSGTTNELHDVSFVNSMFVTVGADGTVVSSTDGVNWTIQTSVDIAGTLLYDIDFIDNMYVAVGDNGTVMTSSDLLNWVSPYTAQFGLLGVAYGNSTYVVVGAYNQIMTSSDGVSWTEQTSGLGQYTVFNSVIYESGEFVVVGNSGALLTSDDGVNWTNQSGIMNELFGIAYGNGTYVAVGDNGTIMTSVVGEDWYIRSPLPTLNELNGVAYANNTYVAVGSSNTIVTSSDGVSWTTRQNDLDMYIELRGIGYINNKYVAVGDGGALVTSDDGANWTSQTSDTMNQLFGITYGNGLYVAVGNSGTIVTSMNGTIWTSSMSSDTTNTLNSVTYGNGTYVAVGVDGTIVTSIDGVSWMNQLSNTTDNFNSVVYGNSMYVAVGASGIVMTSSDGASWTAQTSGTSNTLRGVVYGNGTYMAVGSSGTIVTSLDGVNWTSKTSSTSKNLRAVAYNDGIYVATGNSGTILRSLAAQSSAPTGVEATAGDGQVSLSWNSAIGAMGYKVYLGTGSGSYDITPVATMSGTVYTATGLTNGTTYYFVVKASNDAGDSANSNEVSATPVALTTPSPTVTAPSAPPTNTGAEILVNGKAENAGTVTTTKVNGQSVTTVVVDSKKLEERLAAEGDNAVITIPVNTKSDVVIGELDGQMVKNMEQKQAVVEIRTENATYTLPAQQINIDSISDQLGKTVMLQDIKIRIEISKPTSDTLNIVENAAATGGFTLVVPALNFTVKAIYGDTTIEVSKFNAYVERTIAIPDGVDSSKITTGVVIEPDGTVRHVPTRIVIIDGKYYAKVNSFTNSTYSIVWHPQAFTDVEHHWAKDAVNDMGSRMVISGIGEDMFNPDQDITRAEFVAIMVRGLGMKIENGSSPFVDVNTTDWYSGAVQTAYAYQLISGFEDDGFHPMDKITREQAMTIIARAMKITGLQSSLQAKAVDELLSPYTDENNASVWAKNSIAECLHAGIVAGRSNSQLAPEAYISRAEVAAIVQRLLKKSRLI